MQLFFSGYASLNDWQKLIMLFFGFYIISTSVPSIFNYKRECMKADLHSCYSYKFI